MTMTKFRRRTVVAFVVALGVSLNPRVVSTQTAPVSARSDIFAADPGPLFETDISIENPHDAPCP